jgi:hypothetical protein
MPLTQVELPIDRLVPLLAGAVQVIVLLAAIQAIRPASARDLLGLTAAGAFLVLPFILLELINRRTCTSSSRLASSLACGLLPPRLSSSFGAS